MPTSLLAIDPSIVSLGAAYLVDGQLRAAWLVKGPLPTASPPAERCGAMARKVWEEFRQISRGSSSVVGPEPDHLVLEWPVVRAAGRGAGDNSDLLLVSGVAAAVATLAGPATRVYCVKPEEWKGQVPKDVMAARVMSKLAEAEKSAIHETAPSLVHNVLDAVGIGKWYCDRPLLNGAAVGGFRRPPAR